MLGIKKVVLLVPCFNEERGVGLVLNNIPVERLEKNDCAIEVVVIDNNSTDQTAAIAQARGARVVHESKKGKGNAVLRGLLEVPGDADYIALIDGDYSYDIMELPRLLEPLQSNFCDAVVGTRLNGKVAENAMRPFNRLGNWLFTFLMRVGYKTNLTDVCSGFYVFRKDVADRLAMELESSGFSLEMEIFAKIAKMNYACCSVPISYYARNGTSHLRPIVDGFAILSSWLRYLFWKPSMGNSIEFDYESDNSADVPVKA